MGLIDWATGVSKKSVNLASNNSTSKKKKKKTKFKHKWRNPVSRNREVISKLDEAGDI